MYKIRNFFSRMRRAWRFAKHGWSHPAWYEDYEFFNTLIFSLEEIDRSLSSTGMIYTLENDLKWIRLTKKLLKMHFEELNVNVWHSTKPRTSGALKEAVDKDFRYLEIAMKIIAEKGRGWWI